MITKSDILILLISFSVLMFGLFRTFEQPIDRILNGRLNISEWLSNSGTAEVAQVTDNNMQQPASLSADLESTAPLTKQAAVLAPASTQKSPLLIPDSQQLVTSTTSTATVTTTANTVAANTTAAVVTAQEKPVTRLPGKTTVLVLSTRGNPAPAAALATQPADPATVETVALLNDSDGIGNIDSIGTNDDIGNQAIEPAKSETPVQPIIRTEPEQAPVRIHQVQSGENLSIIAAKHGTTVQRLKQINRLSSDRILAGQNLIYEN